ncbi:NRDE family protein [Ornithinibacillus salinisoli]|uniref:NRDE family protein n=1 Tax=Ornithinibacillus salinisoli TaxID=1848459 RepID=A0ABW4VTR1_9BACI
MCLINFQFHEHPQYKLIVAANRDEFFKRPTAQAHFWEDVPNVLAGRDLLQMGTWLGITKQGRFAALTNFRDPAHMGTGKKSRGDIVRRYLAGHAEPQNFLQSIQKEKEEYFGFNVILGNPDQLYYYNNIQNEISEINKGETHGLSNHFLNTPWPKVVKGRKNLYHYVMETPKIDVDQLFQILLDAEEAPDEELPNTGIGAELERKLSSLFIHLPDYGTRSSTVLLIDHNNQVTFVERTYHDGKYVGEKEYTFMIG